MRLRQPPDLSSRCCCLRARRYLRATRGRSHHIIVRKLVFEWIIGMPARLWPKKVTPTSIEQRNRFHVILSELEVEDLEIFLNSGGSHTLGNHRSSSLYVPAQNHLSHRSSNS
mmetsp:Transcript_11654/g.23694  ORF Transcript_11654/g.23694 Transcript_11654/m.23694 type:complete len:113 (+) Transcript_11654:1443-1781(+)